MLKRPFSRLRLVRFISLITIMSCASCAQRQNPPEPMVPNLTSISNSETIHLQLNDVGSHAIMNKEEFLAKCSQKASDELGTAKARSIAEQLYPEYMQVSEELLQKHTQKSDADNLNAAFFHTFLGRHENQMDSLVNIKKLGFDRRIENLWHNEVSTIKPLSGGGGKGSYYISIFKNSPYNSSTPKMDVVLDVEYTKVGDVFKVDITKVGATADNLNLNTDLLMKFIRETAFPPLPKANIYYFTSKVNDQLEARYVKRKATVPKSEHKYRVDLATAQARLQRALGDFKYNTEKTTFTISNKYRNDSNYTDVQHYFKISLFPDRNDTVVEISGDYEYFKDTYGGPDMYGSAAYNETQSNYNKLICDVLGK